jgi:cell division protein FtsB
MSKESLTERRVRFMSAYFRSSSAEKVNRPPAVKKKRKRRKSPLLVLCILFLLPVIAGRGKITAIWEAYQQKIALENEIDALSTENKELERQIQWMQGNSWVEQAAREKLGLVKPGEIIYIPIGEGQKAGLDKEGLD